MKINLNNKNLKNHVLKNALKTNFQIKKEIERMFLRQDVYDSIKRKLK